MKPTIGRIVHYRHSGASKVRPAIIVEIYEESVLLAVIEPSATPFGVYYFAAEELTAEGIGAGANGWFWPPIVSIEKTPSFPEVEINPLTGE